MLREEDRDERSLGLAGWRATDGRTDGGWFVGRVVQDLDPFRFYVYFFFSIYHFASRRSLATHTHIHTDIEWSEGYNIDINMTR